MTLLNLVHEKAVHTRRVRRLATLLSGLVPETGSLLDVGCGDGRVARCLADHKPGLRVEGIDVLVRPETAIPVRHFDGLSIPHADDSFDAVMLVDVLHHSEQPLRLLEEARRVARRWIVIKDHNRNGLFANATLRFMDWVGNAHHGVALPYHYWSRQEWRDTFRTLNLSVARYEERLQLYPLPADWLFGRSLHFIAQAEVTG